jgi:hypothetical protein
MLLGTCSIQTVLSDEVRIVLIRQGVFLASAGMHATIALYLEHWLAGSSVSEVHSLKTKYKRAHFPPLSLREHNLELTSSSHRSLYQLSCYYHLSLCQESPGDSLRPGLISFDGTINERSGAHVHLSGGACRIIHSPGANQGQRIVAEFEAITPHSEVASAALVLGPEAQV